MNTITTVGDLIAALEDYDPETPIMLAHQPSWPLAETIATVIGNEDIGDDACPAHPDYDRGHPGCDVDEDDDDGPATVWLVAGGHAWDRSPYAPRWVFDGVPS